MNKKLTNDQKIELVINDLKTWAYGNESLDSLNFALKHNFRLHAASLWIGSGAMSEDIEDQISGIKINRINEKKEIKDLIGMADVFICQDCNFHSFIEKNDCPVTVCECCLGTNLKIDIKEGA